MVSGVAMHRLATVAIAFAAGVAPLARAADAQDAAAPMRNYWGALVAADYRASSAAICPAELEALKTDLLPVLLQGGNSGDAEVREYVDGFFQGVAPADRPTESGAQLFEQLMRATMGANAELAAFFRTSRMTVVQVSVDTRDPARATLKYELAQTGLTQTDFQEARLVDGRWCLVLKQRPEATAAKFRKLFNL